MEKSTKDTLSNRLVQLRTEKGWTQSDLVEKMYLSQRTISHIEKGDCTLSNLIQLADLYEVSVDYLLGRSTERRFITLGLDPLTTDIIEQLNLFTTAEKEILLCPLLVFHIHNYIVNRAIKNFAELVDCCCTDR